MRNKIKKNRWISWILTLAMLCSLLQTSAVPAFAADAAGAGVNITGATKLEDDAAEITTGGTYTIGATRTSALKINTTAPVTLVLDGVTIETATAPIELVGGAKVTLVPKDGTTNVLTCSATDLNAGNSGRTAGILVPETASLTIDRAIDETGTGKLTVQGGYGSAGIGASGVDGYTETRNNNGGAGGYWGNGGWSPNNGGQGGRNGIDAPAAGSVTINSGVLAVTGGKGGAGIGGGMGAVGETGTNGGAGTYQYIGGYNYDGHFSSGGGGGGAGGNGGRGGNGGTVTINGGTVNVTGGCFTYERYSKVITVEPAGIGGGSGGIGGVGGLGGANRNAPSGRDAGHGGAGQTGYMNYGGSGGTLTVTGGKVTVTGNKGVGNSGNQVGQFCAQYDYNYQLNWYIGTLSVGGGGGGTAIQPTNVQTPANINITASNDCIDFVDYNGATSFAGRPTDKNNVKLYKVVLTVKNVLNGATVPNAKVAINVNWGNTAMQYTYGSVSRADGTAILWLPAGDYPLAGTAVQADGVGHIPRNQEKMLTVAADDANTAEIDIGADLVLSVSPGDQKVYDAPVDLKVDAADIDGTITGIRWFRESVSSKNVYSHNPNTQIGEQKFGSGYDTCTDANRGSFSLTGVTNKIYSTSVDQNGKYWVEVQFGASGAIVRSIDVKNIYRSFPIQVRSQELNRDGGIRQTGEYGPLKTKLGLDYIANYGFAWDLDGYNSTAVAQGTLIENPPQGYDEVSVYALDSKAKWYTAHIGTMDYERKDDRTGFKDPITLTLDQSFLTNTYADQVDGTQNHDISKYTITYKLDGVPVAEFPIRGILQNADGSEQKQLWQIVGTYPEGVTEATIDPIPQPGYRVDSVLVDGVKKDLDANNSIHLTDLQGTQENNYNDAIKKVEFVYVSNMVEVTVKAMYNSQVFDTSTRSLEKGVPVSITAPTIPGKTATEIAKTITPSDTDKEVVFDYTQNVGNITVIAVEKDTTNELYRKDGGTVNNGDKIELIGEAAAPAVKYFTKTGDAPVVKVNNVVVTDPANYTYNGVGDVTVTYTYTRDKHSLTVKKMDIDTNKEIPGSAQTIPDLLAGQQYFFRNTVTTPNDYAPVGGLNPTAHLVEATDGEVTFWYRKAGEHRYAAVTVECFYTKNGQETVFHSYQFPAFKDIETTITAPTLMGYKLKDSVQNTKTIKPKGVADDDKVRFEYVLDAPREITVELVNHEGTKLTAPTGYKTAYTIKKGDSVQISAPAIDGYTLTSQDSVVTVEYTTQLPGGGDTVTFTYQPVSQANFVTHTVKFQLNGTEIYEYAKLILKAAGTTEYTETSVKMTIPGYKLNNIALSVDGTSTTNSTAVKAPNDKDATIIYHFDEDAAEIVIKQTCTKPETSGGHGTKKTTLTGYRVGQENIVVLAPPLEGHVLAPGQPLFHQFAALTASNEVEFRYDGVGDVVFELYEYDSPGVGSTVIQRINGVAGTTYNPNAPDDPLNLTSIGYELYPCDLAHNDFKENGNKTHKVESGDKATIKVYYRKITRPVHFYAIDSALYPKPADMKAFDLNTAKNKKAIINGNGNGEQLTETARVAETYKASALSIDFYKLDDDLSKYYYVDKTNDLNEAVNVYFWYRAKGSEDVTVSYQAVGQTILSYTVTATKGEKLALKAPAYLEDGKYKRADGQAENITVDVTSTKIVELQYEPNFVNVRVQTVTDGEAPSNYDNRQVNKTDGQGVSTNNLTLTPPYKGGYTLVGIAVQTDSSTEGGADQIPDGIYDKGTGKLNLTALDKDTVVTYYYKTTTASEYQVPLTIRYLYNGYALKADKQNFPVNKGEANTIEVPAFDGYTASTYTFQNGTNDVHTDLPIPAGGLQITPTAATGLTLTIHYTRTDGTVVLPGKDDKIPAPDDKDNVIVKPDPAKPPTIDDDGNVKIDPADKDASVTRPINPNKPDQGKEEVKVPGGTVIKPDGTIELPKNPDGSGGGTINPGDRLPDAVPNGYRAVVYKANGGVGDDQINIYRNNEQIFTITNPFTNGGKSFTGWSTAENGVSGTNFGENAEVTGITGNVTLYAQWGKKNTDGSVELPGKDGIFAAPNDKDNVIVKPDKPNGTLNGPNQPDGSVKVENGDATVTRPDPTDPNFPEGGKEEIKVPEGSMIYPDGTIKLPDGTIIKPDTKLPDGVISNTYAIVTYEPNGGSGNVIRQMVKKNEASKALSGDVFTAPRGMIFEQWKNVTEDQTIAAGGDFTPTKDLTLRAQWKEKAQTPTSYTAQIVFVSNTNDGTTHTQTITGINSKLITGQLDAYVFTLPADWKFMGWSTIKAASRHATVYADSATVTLKEGTTLKLYAILYQVDKNTKVVTLPGADGQPEGTDNVTVTPPAGTDITLGNGYVEAPKGSEITQPAGKIEVMEGTVIVYPDGSIYVPDGSQVKLPNGTTVNGEANIDKDGNVDKDKDKPIQKPDGTIVLPGEDKKTGTDDDIIVKPAGPNKPAGRIDEDGNVTITDPDGADVTFPGKNPENVKLPIGTVITPDGEVTLTYTLKYVDDKGKELETAELVQIKDGATEKVKALSINGYNLKGEAVKSITGTLSTALNDYIITFTYEKQKSDGGSGGSGGGGGGSVIVIGGGGGGSSLNPQKPTIITDGNLKYTLSKDGSSASLTPNDGYEINSIIVNGEEKGGAEAITGLKTGDIVKISAICYLDVIEEAQSYKLAARSKQIKRKNGMHPVKVKVTWYDENGKELKLDGYEIERSRKRYSGYQLRFKTDREVYYNTYIENGAKYYYRVRGYILFKGEKYYTNWSKKAWRTVKM